MEGAPVLNLLVHIFFNVSYNESWIKYIPYAFCKDILRTLKNDD